MIAVLTSYLADSDSNDYLAVSKKVFVAKRLIIPNQAIEIVRIEDIFNYLLHKCSRTSKNSFCQNFALHLRFEFLWCLEIDNLWLIENNQKL